MDSPNPTQSPSSVRTVLNSNQSDANAFVLSLLTLPDSSPIFDCSSFGKVLDKALASVSDELVRDHLVNRALKFASLLKQYSRKRACAHNATSWFLPSDLTVKIFSMLDKKSLMKAAACCTMFNNCAMSPICYSHIDLEMSTKYADAKVVGPMIHRAGTKLRSHLRSLRLYNLSLSARYSLRNALLVCSNITELKIVGPLFNYSCVRFDAAEELFNSLIGKCRLLEHLLLDIHDYKWPEIGSSSLVEFVTSCPNLTSLTLKDLALTDRVAQILVQSCHKMAYLNLSGSRIQGRFLRYLALSCQEGPLKYVILRESDRLEERALKEFCNSLLTGTCKSIQHIDVSSYFYLAPDGGHYYEPNSAKGYRVCDEEDLRLIEMIEADRDRSYVTDYYPERDDDEFSLTDAQELIDSWL